MDFLIGMFLVMEKRLCSSSAHHQQIQLSISALILSPFQFFFLSSPNFSLFFPPLLSMPQTNCSPPVVHSTLSKVLTGRKKNKINKNLMQRKTSWVHIYGDALSFLHDTLSEQSSARVCLASALNLHLILSNLPPRFFFFFFFCSSFRRLSFCSPLTLPAW